MLLWIAAGGFLGSLSRLWTSRLLARVVPAEFPSGTLAVNWIGSFLTGLLAGGAALPLPRALHLAILSGFLGGYTTFSTFTYESAELLRSGERGAAAWNVALQVLGGAALALLGMVIA